jgi:hypothetical protein
LADIGVFFSDFLLDYVHNVSLGWVKRITLLTFEIAGRADKEYIIKLINKFDFAAAGLQFTQSGSRVVKFVFFLLIVFLTLFDGIFFFFLFSQIEYVAITSLLTGTTSSALPSTFRSL